MMRIGRLLLAGTALVLCVTGLAAGQDVAAKADAYLNTWAKQGRFSGAVLIAKDDKILLRKGYGMANFELNVPNTPDTVFRIGSITKMFTAFSILQLEERGLLKTTDPAVKYIPELPATWSAITIHELLCHKSGIPDFINAKAYGELDNPLHVENAVKEYADKPLLSPPGETLRYSNSGYILLGRIVEKISGQTYEEYLQANILGPAGMTHTAFDHATPLVPNRANGYNFDGEAIVNTKPGDAAYGGAAGALRSTLYDLLRFDGLLKSGKLFSPAITAKAWTPYGHWFAPPPLSLEADYGYGWMIGNSFGHRYIGHGGWVNGFVSQFMRFPDDHAVLIVLSNIETGTYIKVTDDLTAILFDQKYEIPVARTVAHPAPEILKRYTGDYELGPLKIKITFKNGRLYAIGTGQPLPYGMIALSDTDFYFNDTVSEVHFITGDDGKVNQFILKLDGREMPVNRVAEPLPGK
jgi:CubicO group peptidase (beta-lactamase class C family)